MHIMQAWKKKQKKNRKEKQNMKKAVVCVLLGDASGVGAEIVAKAFSDWDPQMEKVRVVFVGDKRILKRAEDITAKKINYTEVTREQIRKCKESLMFLDSKNIDPQDAVFGKVNPKCGQAVAEDIRTACELFAEEQIDGICFAPFNKEAIRKAGNDVNSELGLFEKNCNELGLKVEPETGELNVVDGLWTTRVTSHIPLTKVGEFLTEKKIVDMIRLADKSCRAAGIENPRIAIAALNPHCGEGGLCGDEEQVIIKPAIETARSEGYNITGMYAPDTTFVHAFNNEADVVVTMYHDQGQIALKLREFDHAVTILAGFPMPIGTPAHGTAHDIAGKGIAHDSAFKTAFEIIANQSVSSIK